MATEFKRFTMTNVASSGTFPTTASYAVSKVDLYRPAPTVDAVIIGLLLTNTIGSSITADVAIVTNTDGSGAGDDVYLIKGAQIPVGSALEVISGKVVVSNTHASDVDYGDRLQVMCSDASALDVTLSVLENS